jgi:hypothetical protein
MAAIDAAEVRELLEATVASVSMLGGSMAYFSGFAAAKASAEQFPPEVLGQAVNEGLALGFLLGSPLAVATLMIEACT